LRHLRLFYFAVEEGTLRKAAEKANLSQPAVTQAIARLEQQFACDLLERTTSGVDPTPAGRILHVRVERMFDYLQEMARTCESVRRSGNGGMAIDRLIQV
jgi:DNA-binding transcriptional LysR family regulator